MITSKKLPPWNACKAEDTVAPAKGFKYICSASPTKKWLEEVEAQVVFFWLNTCGWSSKVGPTGKRPHHQANPQFLMRPQRRPSPIGHDEANSCLFLLKIHLSLQKGTNYKHICSASPTKKWAGNVRIGVLRCSRRGLFVKVVILATQKICLATAYVRGCFLSIVWGMAPRNLFDIRGE